MLSMDDAVTTVALFLFAAAVLYLARGAFFVLLLSLLFAYRLSVVTNTAFSQSLMSEPLPELPPLLATCQDNPLRCR